MFRAVIVAAVVMLGASRVAGQHDVLDTLGATLADARDSIFSSIVTGTPALTGNRAVFKAASLEHRASMVRAVIAIARAFAATPDFTRRYALYREAQQPRRSTAARTGDEARTQQQAAMELAIKQAMAGAERMPAEARKELEANIADMRKQIAELNADPSYRAIVDQAASAAAQEEDAEIAKQIAVFNNEFPEDVNALMARRLRQFLLACGDVDFDAKLTEGPDDTLRFVNPAYERRSAEWKMCFRAGKPAVTAARAVAEEWLNSLNKF
jgi:hypothetical protein